MTHLPLQEGSGKEAHPGSRCSPAGAAQSFLPAPGAAICAGRMDLPVSGAGSFITHPAPRLCRAKRAASPEPSDSQQEERRAESGRSSASIPFVPGMGRQRGAEVRPPSFNSIYQSRGLASSPRSSAHFAERQEGGRARGTGGSAASPPASASRAEQLCKLDTGFPLSRPPCPHLQAGDTREATSQRCCKD